MRTVRDWLIRMPLMIIALVCAVWLIAGCNGSSEEDDTSTCQTADVGEQNVEAMRWVEVSLEFEGDVDIDQLSAELVVEGIDPFATLVVEGEEGDLWIYVPVHPDGIGGGPMDLRMSHADEPCPDTGLTVEPMDEAPGAFADLVTELERLVETEAEDLGTNIDELIDLLDHDATENHPPTPVNYVPLAWAQFLLDHPDNPDSLQSLAGGGASALGEDSGTHDFALLEAMIAHTGLVDHLSEQADALEALDALQYNWIDEDASSGPTASVALADGLLRIDIRSTQELSDVMTRGDHSCRTLDDPSLRSINASVGLMSAVPHQLTKAFGAGYSSVMTTLVEIDRATCGLYPNRLSNFRPGVDEIEIEEDRDELPLATMYTDAVSEGWDITETAIEVLFELISLMTTDFGPRPLKGTDFKNMAEATLQPIGEFMESYVDSLLMGVLKDRVHVLNDLTGEERAGPYLWIDFELDTKEYVSITSVLTEDVDPGLALEPQELGESTATITARADKFPPEGASQQVPIAVRPIEIGMPERKLVVPGESLLIDFTVDNANDRRLAWTSDSDQPDPEDVNTGSSETNAGTGTVVFETPTDENAYPVGIYAESLTETGLRHPSHDPDPLQGFTLVVNERISLGPNHVCVPPGETQEFSVVTLREDADITWHPAERMEIVDETTAIYTAPSSKGEEEVSVEVEFLTGDVAHQTFEDTAHVKVDDCLCWWSVDFLGHGTVSGDYGYFSSMTPETWDASLGGDSLTGSGGYSMGLFNLYFVDGEGAAAGATHHNTLHIQGDVPKDHLIASPDRSRTHITSYDGQYVEGVSTGEVWDSQEFGQGNVVPIPYSMSFRLDSYDGSIDLEDEDLDNMDEFFEICGGD